jgi:hypothetical protein
MRSSGGPGGGPGLVEARTGGRPGGRLVCRLLAWRRGVTRVIISARRKRELCRLAPVALRRSGQVRGLAAVQGLAPVQGLSEVKPSRRSCRRFRLTGAEVWEVRQERRRGGKRREGGRARCRRRWGGVVSKTGLGSCLGGGVDVKLRPLSVRPFRAPVGASQPKAPLPSRTRAVSADCQGWTSVGVIGSRTTGGGAERRGGWF